MKGLINKFIMNGLGSLSLKISSVILNIYVARTSNIDIYSLYAIITSSIVLFGTTYLNVISQLSSSYKNNNTIIYSISFTILYISLVFLLFINLYDKSIHYILGLVLTCIVLSAPLLGELYKNGKHKLYAKFCSIAFVCFLSFIICDYYLFLPKITNYILLYAIPYLVLLISLIYYFYVNNKFNIKLSTKDKFSLASFKSFSSQALYLLSASGLVPLCFWIIYNLFSENVGTYNIAIFVSLMQWSWIISQFSVVAGNVLISKVKSTSKADDKVVSFLNLYSAWLPASCVIGFLMSLHEFHFWVFGSNYYSEDMLLPYFIVLAVSILNAFKSFIYRLIVAADKNYLSLISNIIWLISFVSGVYFIDNLSLLMFSMLYLLSSLLSFIIMLPIYLKIKLFSYSEVFFNSTSICLLLFSLLCFFNGFAIDYFVLRLVIFLIMFFVLLFVFYRKIRKGFML